MRAALLARQRERLSRGPVPSRAVRLANAPKEPKRSALVYAAALRKLVVKPMQAAAERVLIPELPRLLRATPPPARKEDRHDGEACAGCGGSRPWWYAPALARRADELDGPWNVVIGQLEVALSDIAKPSRLRKIIIDAAQGVDELNRVELSRVLRVNLREDPMLAREIDGFIRTNVDLITTIKQRTLDRVEERISEATSTGLRVESLAEDLMRDFGVTEARANLIARDQTLKLNADLTQLRQQEVGVEEYIWTSSNDERVRGRPGGMWENSQADHWILDGTTQSWLRPPITNPVKGDANHPGQDYQCRCIAYPRVQGIIYFF